MYSATFWEIFFSVAAFVFILPTLIGAARGVRDLTTVILFNVLALVSLGVGWIAAMGFACFGESRRPPRGMRRTRLSHRAGRMYRAPGPLGGTPFESVARFGPGPGNRVGVAPRQR